MNDLEKQIYAMTFAAAFERDWAFRVANEGVKKAMEGTKNGFQYAEVADQAVQSHRIAMSLEDSNYLLIKSEQWDVAR